MYTAVTVSQMEERKRKRASVKKMHLSSTDVVGAYTFSIYFEVLRLSPHHPLPPRFLDFLFLLRVFATKKSSFAVGVTGNRPAGGE